MTVIEIIGLLFIHWLADFVYQEHRVAVGKSKSLLILLEHGLTYSITFTLWIFAMLLILYYNNLNITPLLIKISIFAGITFLIHTFTDFITSKITANLWKKEKVHNFFVMIGFDQLLHYIQIFITYHLIFIK